MADQDTEHAPEGHPRDDDRDDVEGTPVPDPEEEQGDTDDVPTAD
jgi:hypothetical protein